MKIFISQPMHGLTDKEVLSVRNKAIEYLKNKYSNVEIIENYFHEDAPENAGRLWHLAKSIQLLDDADAIYFCENWESARGCNVEYFIAVQYGIEILNWN